MTEDGILDARRLLRAARTGALATNGPDGPHASLVTPASTVEGDVLLLLSALSAHTRALAADRRCALLVTGAPADANPQTAPRVTLRGEAEPLDGDLAAVALARFVAIHPYAALYGGFGDFAPWRLRPRRALFVAGFGRARTLDGARWTVADPLAGGPPGAFAGGAPLRALDGPDSAPIDSAPIGPAAIGPATTGPAPIHAAPIRWAAIDADGVDLVVSGAEGGPRTVRHAFAAPSTDRASLELSLGRLAGRPGVA